MNNEQTFWDTLCARLKNLRDSQGWTQDDVASRVGIGKSAYRSYENNDRRIPVDVLTRVAALYNVSVDELLGNSVRPNASINIIHGNFTEEQIQKIQKYAELVRNNEL
jgi:transcriptional regulator with XRE-family HTH domain